MNRHIIARTKLTFGLSRHQRDHKKFLQGTSYKMCVTWWYYSISFESKDLSVAQGAWIDGQYNTEKSISGDMFVPLGIP